jgi:hypothetical protein
MRYRFMATYRGIPYEAGVGPSDSDIVLFAACPPPEELGFQPATGHWRKAVTRAEVDAVWESKPSGVFGGEPCLVLDELGDQLHIGYPGHDPVQAERLGYCEVEPGVFEVLVNREDVGEISEERVDRRYPLAASSWPATQVPAWSAPTAPAWPAPVAMAPVPPPPAAPLPPLPSFPALPSRPAPAPMTSSAPVARMVNPMTISPAPVAPPVAPVPVTRTASLAPVAQSASLAPVAQTASLGPMAQTASLAPETRTTSTAAPPARRRHGGSDTGPSWAQTRQTFTELANLAAIPPTAYAVNEAVNGAICLLRTDTGFEVFSAVDGTRQEIRLFADEEAAYFYMFGLLAAEAVRDGRLIPPR